MGIPIGWNISRNDAKEKDVLRADVTGQRSPIRRRIRTTRSPASRSAFEPDFWVSSSGIARYLEPTSRSSHARTYLPPPPVPEVSRSAYRSSDSTRDPPTLQREDASFRRSRLHNFERESIRALSTTDLPLPRFTTNFAPAAARSAEAEARPEARDSSPGFEYFEFRRTPGVRLTRSRSPRSEQSTRAQGADASDEGHEASDNAVSFPPLRRMGRRNIADGPLPASSLRESWSPVSTVDGLGDRERSVSPYEEHLPWDTFVVPDPVAPTAESSFASAAASASFSNSHPSSRAGSSNTSASSSRTHLTVPSRRQSLPANEQFMRACDTSDDDTASDTEAEDDEDTHRYQSITLLRPSYFSDEPPHRDPERYSRRILESSRNASSYVQRFYNSGSRPRSMRGALSSPYPPRREGQSARPRLEQLDGPTDEGVEESRDAPADSLADGPIDGPAPASEDEVPVFASLSSPLDQELREARSLLERLSRREDVSDDFWASVGLTRSFADRVESFNERDQL